MKKNYNFIGRREVLELLTTLLQKVEIGYNKPTVLMYAVNLNWRTTQKLIKMCLDKKWLKIIEDDHYRDHRTSERYQITDSGVNLVRSLEPLMLQIYPDYR